MKKPVLVIMAAGMGSRYGGLKQIDPVDPEGHIIMDFSLYDAKKAGFEEVIFIIKKVCMVWNYSQTTDFYKHPYTSFCNSISHSERLWCVGNNIKLYGNFHINIYIRIAYASK